MYLIKTQRLGLRNWQPSDLEPFIQMNEDKDVMAYFPKLLTAEESEASFLRYRKHFGQRGYCYFAAELLENRQFIGFIGLMYQEYESPFTPGVDIGWRLRKEYWGNGYAPEGAKACLGFAFGQLGLEDVFAVAPKLNSNSERVMQKIGMAKQEEFGHPGIDPASPLHICNLYRASLPNS